MLLCALPLSAQQAIYGAAEILCDYPLYQLFVIMKSGIKTGYLSTDYPSFALDDEVVHFTTNSLSLDIPKDELDLFTLEQVLPEHPVDISMQSELTMTLGSTARLTYQLSPADAQTTVTWFNSDKTVATVSPQGEVTPLAEGTTTLTAQTSNGLRAACMVTVLQPQWRLYVWHHSGTYDAYDLDNHPEVILGQTTLTLTTDQTSIEYLTEDVSHFTMRDAAVYHPENEVEVTGLSQTADDAAREPLFEQGTVNFDHLQAGAVLRIYDASGRLVRRLQADGDGRLRFSVASLGKGLFIIKSETSTIKIHQK